MAPLRNLKDIAADARHIVAEIDRFEPLVEEYLQVSGMSQTRFGALSSYGIDFIRLMRRKRGFSVATVRKVLSFMGQPPSPTP